MEVIAFAIAAVACLLPYAVVRTLVCAWKRVRLGLRWREGPVLAAPLALELWMLASSMGERRLSGFFLGCALLLCGVPLVQIGLMCSRAAHDDNERTKGSRALAPAWTGALTAAMWLLAGVLVVVFASLSWGSPQRSKYHFLFQAGPWGPLPPPGYTGVWREWAPNGQLVLRCPMEDGRWHGRQTKWFETGRKAAERHYWHGRQHGPEVRWDEAGRKVYEAYYRNGDLDGLEVGWHASGHRAFECRWANGRAKGMWTWWHPNGQKEQEGAFLAGERHGRWTEWDRDGNVVSTTWYLGGKEVPEAEYRRRTAASAPRAGSD